MALGVGDRERDGISSHCVVEIVATDPVGRFDEAGERERLGVVSKYRQELPLDLRC